MSKKLLFADFVEYFEVFSFIFDIFRNTIWQIRIKRLEELVLRKWSKFTIWNAGKQGRKFYRFLSEENRKKVSCFCDVDVKKVGSFYTFEQYEGNPKPKVPILHYRKASRPFIICVKMVG